MATRQDFDDEATPVVVPHPPTMLQTLEADNLLTRHECTRLRTENTMLRIQLAEVRRQRDELSETVKRYYAERQPERPKL